MFLILRLMCTIGLAPTEDAVEYFVSNLFLTSSSK